VRRVRNQGGLGRGGWVIEVANAGRGMDELGIDQDSAGWVPLEWGDSSGGSRAGPAPSAELTGGDTPTADADLDRREHQQRGPRGRRPAGTPVEGVFDVRGTTWSSNPPSRSQVRTGITLWRRYHSPAANDRCRRAARSVRLAPSATGCVKGGSCKGMLKKGQFGASATIWSLGTTLGRGFECW